MLPGSTAAARLYAEQDELNLVTVQPPAVRAGRVRSANGLEFSAPITIPSAAPDLYRFVVLAPRPAGEIGNTRTVAFQVTEEGPMSGESSSPGAERPETVERTASRPTVSTAVLTFAGGGALDARRE